MFGCGHSTNIVLRLGLLRTSWVQGLPFPGFLGKLVAGDVWGYLAFHAFWGVCVVKCHKGLKGGDLFQKTRQATEDG